MTDMNREELIEKAAKALHEEIYGEGWWEHREQVEDNLYRRRAERVLAVFEQAHTPTDHHVDHHDGEREALVRYEAWHEGYAARMDGKSVTEGPSHPDAPSRARRTRRTEQGEPKPCTQNGHSGCERRVTDRENGRER